MITKVAISVCMIFLVAVIITGCEPSSNSPTPNLQDSNAALPTSTTNTDPDSASPTLAHDDSLAQNSPNQVPAQTPFAEPDIVAVVPPTTTQTANGGNSETQVSVANTSQSPASSQPTPAPVVPPLNQTQDCEDEAAYYADITIPDGTWLSPGSEFTKTWQVRNSGSCAWEGYALVFASGDVMSAPLVNPLPVIAPGEIADISINMIAPTRGGEQTGNWEFQNAAGVRFGVGSGGTDYIWVQIQVEWQDAGSSQAPAIQPSMPVVSSEGCTAASNADFESQILTLINAGRAEQGLAPLVINPALSSAARDHSQDMACQDFVDHNGSNGSTWYDRVANQGYANSNSARENIYVGDPAFGGTPAGAYAWWMNSPVHRDNILNAAVSEIGIGYMYDQNSEYGGYYTVVFARP